MDRRIVRVRRPVGGRAVIVEPGARVDARDFMNQRDAVLDRADQSAEIAADALSFIDHELTLAIDAGEDRLMRRVFANDVTAPALNAELLIDLGFRDVIEIEILPVGERGNS